jgi:hypothetical protein
MRGYLNFTVLVALLALAAYWLLTHPVAPR